MSKPMNISDEAVDAGYAAVGYLVIGRDEIRAILEASAPHLMAAAWDEGCAEGFKRGDDPQRLEGYQPNPYRSGRSDSSE